MYEYMSDSPDSDGSQAEKEFADWVELLSSLKVCESTLIYQDDRINLRSSVR